MKIFVIGSGGREHAMVSTLRSTRAREIEIICAPGSAGIASVARCVPIEATDVRSLAKFAAQEEVALTLVGGEAPLAAGIGDVFNARGLKIAAPTAAAAQLETSKAFAKKFMQRHGIPTASFRLVETFEKACEVLRSGKFGASETPVVVKVDGLAGGKGVVVAATKREAEAAAIELLEVPASAGSGQNRLVIEEALTGREASLLMWTDGRDFRLMPPAQDHKRVGIGDTGLNTGGMGAVTASNILDAAMQERIVREIVEPTLAGLEAERLDFRGVLYIGLMLTPNGVRVLEYNVRFGDPEAQAILVRLESDLAQISEAVAMQRLCDMKVKWSDDSSACVVLAAHGYPGKVETGARIEGLEETADNPVVKIFHSGTVRADDGTWRTAGGRVLGITACAATLDDALRRCYRRIENISWDGMHFRTDIGRGLLD